MYIILWLLFGAFIGWVASILTKDNHRMGLIQNIVVGLLGAVVGGVITTLLGKEDLNVFSWTGFAFSVLGAVILLAIINFLQKRK